MESGERESRDKVLDLVIKSCINQPEQVFLVADLLLEYLLEQVSMGASDSEKMVEMLKYLLILFSQ